MISLMINDLTAVEVPSATDTLFIIMVPAPIQQ